MPGKKIDVRCFLEGIQVPFQGATIQISTNQSSTATVQVPALPQIFEVRPRTRVQLFFYDEAGNGSWRILWEGEVLGVGFSKSPGSRSAQLMCKDLSNYWDYVLKYFVTLQSAGFLHTEQKYFYGNTDMKVLMTKAASTEIISNTLKGDKNLPEAIHDLLAGITDTLPVYQNVNERTHLNDQLIIKPDEFAEKLIQTKHFSTLLDNIDGRSPGPTPIRKVLLDFCQLIFYNIVSNPSASYVGNLNSFLLKPNLYGTLPPRCNVILPDLCTSITYHRDFMSEPTRMKLKSNPIKYGEGTKDYFKPSYVAPEELYEKLDEYGNEKDRFKKEFQDELVLTDEEKEKGILPVTMHHSFSENLALATTSKGKRDGDMHDNLRKLTEYFFQMEQYSSRTLSATMEFNPWLVCNFPCLVCDSSQSYMAVIANITHTISASTGAMTNIQCNMVREVREDMDQSPTIPNWMNESYQPDRVNTTYIELFDCKALGSEKLSVHYDQDTYAEGGPRNLAVAEGKRADLTKFALELFNPNDENSLYKQAVNEDRAYSFADAYRRRSIATIEEIARFYEFDNQEKVSDEYLPEMFSGKTFVFKAREVIKNYMRVLTEEGRVLEGK